MGEQGRMALEMRRVNVLGSITGWLLLGAMLWVGDKNDIPFVASLLLTVVKVLGSVAAAVNVGWQMWKWHNERVKVLTNKRMDLFRQLLLRFMEIRYFIGQICGRAMESTIEDDNVFIRINHLLDNQVRNMVMTFSCNALPEYEIIEEFDQNTYRLCEQFQNKCAELVEESKDDAIVGFRISIPNVKAKAYAACNIFDELVLKCTGFIGGDKSRIDALIRDVANGVF